MAIRQDTLWEQFLSPLIRGLLDKEQMLALRDRIAWQDTIDRYQLPAFVYPKYYRTQNYHGIEGGYLTQTAAITYDPITQYVLPLYEPWIRQSLIDEIRSQPQQILDLGCGTGSMTLPIKKAFPNAVVTGVDLSPYMLAVAEDRSRLAGLDIQWQHGTATALTQFEAGSFDLITAALLFHETPPATTQAILAKRLDLKMCSPKMSFGSIESLVGLSCKLGKRHETPQTTFANHWLRLLGFASLYPTYRSVTI